MTTKSGSTPDLPTKVYLNIGERMQICWMIAKLLYAEAVPSHLEMADFLWRYFPERYSSGKAGTEEYFADLLGLFSL